jgi:tRNA dimethylallyltransferase
MAIARAMPVEIISVDSALVYRGMDIGTAKPSADELAAVPHHLIDIIDPAESYSAARFAQDASRLIAEIRARGRMPLLVGGTMLYFKALIDGIDALPQANAEVRAALDAEAAALGWPALHAQLAEVDPVSAARLAPNDSQRVQRALEVWRLTGQPLSSFHTRSERPPATHDAHLLIALEPDDRGWLHRHIALRFERMLDHGLLDEVRTLMARPDLHPNLPSVRCVGYRQAWEALALGLQGESLKSTVAVRGVAATRQLAKRQLTWLRSMSRVPVVVDKVDAAQAALALIHASATGLSPE